jgi:hypothetical protein
MIPTQLLRALNRTLTGVSVAIVTFLLGAPVHAQRVSQDEFAKVATAQAFVRALYPETKDKGYVMNIAASTGFDRKWNSLSDLDVWVGPSDRRSGDTNPPGHAYWKKPEILSALFQFRTSDQFIDEVNIQFVPLESKFEVLRSQVDAHQQWSDQQVIAAMKKAGAKFGPNDEDAFRKEVPIDALEPFIGRLQIESAEFFLRHKQDPRSLAELYWEVDGTSVLPNGQEAHWSLTFEPFAGKLQSLLRGRE